MNWAGSVCPRCQLEDALIRTSRRTSVQLQASNANCIGVVTPAPELFCQSSTFKEMEYWIKSVRAHI
uniref:PH domain-containing protein n=1 Tax=Hyaloperonospora arabidopsidis (strain Emoy2) TaxID=559515 RepID=M4BQE1_HYAAE